MLPLSHENNHFPLAAPSSSSSSSSSSLFTQPKGESHSSSRSPIDSSLYFPPHAATSFSTSHMASTGQLKRKSSSAFFKSCTFVPEYLHRIWNYHQMDFEATYYQMVTLCAKPSKVYKSAYYRKQTRNRWSRDDPAFAVIQVYFLMIASMAWALCFSVSGLVSLIYLVVYSVLIEWLGTGLLVSTLCWHLSNTYLRVKSTQGMGETFFVEQEVEWQYAFDIHCNAFFVFFLIVYVIQFLLLPLLISPSFLALVVANTLYTIALGLYCYITFLGYMALPFLHNTEKFVYPMIVVMGFYVASIFVKILFNGNFNWSILLTSFYYA